MNWLSRIANCHCGGLWRRLLNAEVARAQAEVVLSEDSDGDDEGDKVKQAYYAWNVFVGDHRRGVTPELQSSLTVLSAQYRLLNDEAMSALRRRAEEATHAKRHGNPAPLGPRAPKRRRVPQPAPLRDEGAGAPPNGAMQVFRSPCYIDILQLRRDQRSRRTEELRARCDDAERVREFQATEGVRLRETLFGPPTASSELQDLAFSPQSRSTFSVFVWRHMELMDRVMKFVGQDTRATAQKPVRENLAKVWGILNETVKHQDVPVVKSKVCDPPKPKKRLCYYAKKCVCNQDGKNLVKIHDAINKVVSTKLNAKSPHREALLSSRIVILLLSNLPQLPDPAAPPNPEPPVTSPSSAFWFFLADVMQKPWELFVHEVCSEIVLQQFERAENNRLRTIADGVVKLESAQRDYTDWQASDLLDRGMRWELTFWEARLADKMVPHLEPKYVFVSMLFDGLLHPIWDPFKKRERRRPIPDGGVDGSGSNNTTSGDGSGATGAGSGGGGGGGGSGRGSHHSSRHYSGPSSGGGGGSGTAGSRGGGSSEDALAKGKGKGKGAGRGRRGRKGEGNGADPLAVGKGERALARVPYTRESVVAEVEIPGIGSIAYYKKKVFVAKCYLNYHNVDLSAGETAGDAAEEEELQEMRGICKKARSRTEEQKTGRVAPSDS